MWRKGKGFTTTGKYLKTMIVRRFLWYSYLYYVKRKTNGMFTGSLDLCQEKSDCLRLFSKKY